MNEPAPCANVPTVSSVNRREFLVRTALAGGGSILLGTLGYRGWRALSFHAAPMRVSLPTLNEFVPLLGSTFTVVTLGQQPEFQLTLVKAEALKGHQAQVSESFSLCFAPRVGERIESRIYELVHPALGRLELFLSPVGPAGRLGEGQKVEAIINFDRLAA